MSSSYSIVPNSDRSSGVYDYDVTAEQSPEKVASSVIRWKLIKFVGLTALGNIASLGTLAGGLYLAINSDELEKDNPHIDFLLPGYFMSFFGGIGTVVSLVAPFFHFTNSDYSFLSKLNTPESLIQIHADFITFGNPRLFREKYNIAALVDLKIFPEHRVDEFNGLLGRYDALVRGRRALQNSRLSDIHPNLEALHTREQELEAESVSLDDAWKTFQAMVGKELRRPLPV